MIPQTARGEALTAEILAAVAPLVDGQPSAVVVEAMAGAMLAAVTDKAADLRSAIEAIRTDIFYWMIRNHNRGERSYAMLGDVKERLTNALKETENART